MIKGLTTSFIILIIFLLINLAINVRFAADDYYFIFLNNNYGAIGGAFFQYTDFSGRWLCHFISLLLLNFSSFRMFLPIYFLATFIVFYLVLSSLFYKIYSWYDDSEKDLDSDFAPLLLLTTFFLCSFSIGENWFWFISVSTYMWSLISSLLLINLYLNNKKRFYTPYVLVFASLYIGAASESYAILMILFSGIFITYKIKQEGLPAFKANDKNKTLVRSIILIFIAFLISTLSPGTFHRNELLPNLSLIENFTVLIRSYGKIFIRYLPSKIHLFLIFSLPWMAFGFYIQELATYTLKNIIQKISVTIFLTLSLIFISLLPTVFLLGETGPARALSIITLIFTISFATIFTLLGMFVKRESSILKIISVSFFLSIIYLFYENIKQYRVTNVFSETYDERLLRIDELKNHDFRGIAELPPLPYSGMLFNAELSTDTAYFVNQHWKKGLGLKFNVVLAK